MRRILACVLVAGSTAAAQQTFWSGASGGFFIEWTSSDLRVSRGLAAGATVLSLEAAARTEWKKIAIDSPGQPMQSQTTYRLLSVAGPLLSVEETFYCDCGGAHPSEVKRFRAIDLRQSKPDQAAPLALTSVFPAGDIFAALAADKVVAAALKDDARKPRSLDELIKALKFQPVPVGDCSFFFGDDLLSSFALYDVQRERAAVRISLSHQAEVCRGQMTQLGILLPIPEAINAGLEAAKGRRAGFLMADDAKVASGARTVFSFSTPAR
ncbi:MAG TPA: hypothetical protein VN841_14205 [Bryobacteraceae bacterium]|nr:hypothetical protein [Bryobacteraceae bacterium]